MEFSNVAITLLCIALYTLGSDAEKVEFTTEPLSIDFEDGATTSSPEYETYSTSTERSESITERISTEPFVLAEESNTKPPRRKKVVRRKRIKRIKLNGEPISFEEGSSFTSGSVENIWEPLTTTAASFMTGNGGTLKLAVVPLDSDVSASLPTNPVSTPTSRAPDKFLKPGYYTRHQKRRRKQNLWKVPNFSMELFDTEEVTNNINKRESTTTFSSESNPTASSDLQDVNPEENTSSPISYELQNSLQFSLQEGLNHPLLKSDSVLTEEEPKIPENKTVKPKLSSTFQAVPIAPDVRFVPSHLRKSHPLLSDENLMSARIVTKNVQQVTGLHSMNNVVQSDHNSITTTEAPTTRTTTLSAKTISTTRKHTTTTSVPFVHFEPIDSLKISEILKPSRINKEKLPKHSIKTTPAPAPKKPTSATPFTTAIEIFPTSVSFDTRPPPLNLLGSGSTLLYETDTHNKGTIETPPAFDDLLLEELIKGYDPPTTLPPSPSTTTSNASTKTTKAPKSEDEEILQLLNLLQQQSLLLDKPAEANKPSSDSNKDDLNKLDTEIMKNLALLDNLLSPTAKTLIKEAVDSGTTEKIKSTKPTSEGLSDADLKAIYMLLDAMSSTTPKPTTTTTTTTAKPNVHPALQGILSMLTNPWSEIQQKLKASQTAQTTGKSIFSLPPPPKPVPTASSLDALTQLFNFKPQNEVPQVKQNSDQGLGALFSSFLPKRQPTNREATSSTNQLLSFFQTDPQLNTTPTPSPGPYYWFDMNAFLGQDPTAGTTSGFRPRIGSRDFFMKVRRRRNSAEKYN